MYINDEKLRQLHYTAYAYKLAFCNTVNWNFQHYARQYVDEYWNFQHYRFRFPKEVDDNGKKRTT